MVNDILVLIQARMGSTRLPGKVLKKINGKELLLLQIERILSVFSREQLYIATGDTAENKPLREFSTEHKINCFSGSESDVLDRFYNTAKLTNHNWVLRLTGDNPILDTRFLMEFIKICSVQNADFYHTKDLPIGMNYELFHRSCFEKVFQVGPTEYDKEHVTPAFYRLDSISAQKIDFPFNLNWMSFTVDTQAEFDRVEALYNYFDNNTFNLAEIIEASNQSLQHQYFQIKKT